MGQDFLEKQYSFVLVKSKSMERIRRIPVAEGEALRGLISLETFRSKKPDDHTAQFPNRMAQI